MSLCGRDLNENKKLTIKATMAVCAVCVDEGIDGYARITRHLRPWTCKLVESLSLTDVLRRWG